MSKSHATGGKNEQEKKKAQKRQEKMEKKKERQANSNRGKSLEDMLAYLDENGNLTTTPPDPEKKTTVNAEDIQLTPGARNVEETSASRKGIVKFFNEEKGYGFIIDQGSKESIFVHVSQLQEPVTEGDRVLFETESGAKGPVAVKVRKS